MTAVDDSFYKITSEALLVLHLIVKTIRPLGRCSQCLAILTISLCPVDVPSSFDFHPYVMNVYMSALKRLKAADIDQEVKERAIICMLVFDECMTVT